MSRTLAEHTPYATRSRVWSAPQLIPPHELHQDILRPNGDPNLPDTLRVDGSTTPVSFRWYCPANHVCLLHMLAVYLVDTILVWDGYGTLPTLPNGVVVSIRGTNDQPLFELPAIRSCADYMQFGDASIAVLPGNPLDMLNARLDFHEVTGFVPYMMPGEYVEVLVRDDLTLLHAHKAIVWGRLLPRAIVVR